MNANLIRRQVYFEFSLSLRILRQKKYDYLTPKDDQLLTIVALAYTNGTRLSVVDLVENRDIGSKAAVHKRIQKLRYSSMIEYERTDDRRRYQVIPTDKLLRYFDQLGNSMKAIGKMHLKPK